jgi:hypothetical protein
MSVKKLQIITKKTKNTEPPPWRREAILRRSMAPEVSDQDDEGGITTEDGGEGSPHAEEWDGTGGGR